MLQSLLYHWRIHLAVLVGSAIATAVLTGALLVGDSVRGSLRDLTLQRLGQIDQAVLADRFFSEGLARKIGGSPHILLSGSAATAEGGARARGVQILGIGSDFADLYPQGGADVHAALTSAEGFFPPVVINQTLQSELSVDVGDAILLAFEDPADVHRDFLLGSRSPTDILETRRLVVAAVISDTGPGRFGLRPYQTAPRNAFLRLSGLQKALGREESANVCFLAVSAAVDSTSLRATLRNNATLGDLSLNLRRVGPLSSLESPRYFISDTTVEAALDAASEAGLSSAPLLIYLANSISRDARSVPYSTVCALVPSQNGGLVLSDGSPPPDLGDGEILLNRWTAEDLQASVGDSIQITTYQPEAAGRLITHVSEWKVKGIVGMEGLGADPTLTPEFPGIENADDMAAWDAPFPIDLHLIRAKDEAYWDRYRAAPKAFVSLEAGRRLWSSRFGSTTSVRISGGDRQSNAPQLEKALLRKLDPLDHGFVLAPLREEGLRAAEGATDFSDLFIGFSFFLILSAALLVALLFRLGVEQRSSEVGLLLAVGYPFPAVRRRFMIEGTLLAVTGALPGLAIGVGYAHLMILGLTTWWRAAVGTSHLALHVEPVTLCIGFVLSIGVVFAAVLRSLAQLHSQPVRSLLVGSVELHRVHTGNRSLHISWGCALLAFGLLAIGSLSGHGQNPVLFFGSGSLLLVAGLAAYARWLRPVTDRADSLGGRMLAYRMGVRNTRRRPGRSLLCATLIGCACFVIVSVGANRKPSSSSASIEQSLDRSSGTGGYNLLAQTDVSLYQDLASAEDRSQLGITPEDGLLLEQSEIISFRVREGDDASCLNLYRPQNPTILGVPVSLIETGGFRFGSVDTQSEVESSNPWQVLQRQAAGAIPSFGDANSVQWILHLGLGEELKVSGVEGRDVRLQLAGMLQGSIFQSELLVSEERFREAFPSAGGYRTFLIRTDPDHEDQVEEILEGSLGRFGMDVVRTAERLSAFNAVENTYLSTFQTLGGLGLLLGTIGLAILLFRNVLERTGELAAMRAFGYRKAVLTQMLLAENGFLLLVGIGIGTAAALLAVAPHVASNEGIPWVSLGTTLGIVFEVGFVASGIAASLAMRRPLLAALKEER